MGINEGVETAQTIGHRHAVQRTAAPRFYNLALPNTFVTLLD